MRQTDLTTVFEHRMHEKRLKTHEVNNQLKDAALELYSELNDMKNSFNTKDDGNCLLVCQTPMDVFFSEEDKFQDAVTNFTKILFAESSPDFRPQSEAFGEVLRGLPADSEPHVALREECSRLEAAARLALEAELQAEVRRAREEAKCRELRRLCADPGGAPALLSEEEHRANLTRLHSLRAHIDRLRQSELPALLHDRSCALSAQMELAQLRLQELRHRFFIHRQEKLIRLLLKQQAWDALIVMLHETERRNHKLLLRTLQRLHDHRLQLMAKTGEISPRPSKKIEFGPPADEESVNLNHSSVREALKALGTNQLSYTSEVTAKEANLCSQRNADYLEQLHELQKNVDALCSRLMPEGPASKPQLSFPEVQQLVSSTKAQVKSLSQKVQHFINMTTVQDED